jgi:hypothetical protein
MQRDKQSRRQVQRRFPPGSFVVSENFNRMIGIIVGWVSVYRKRYSWNAGEEPSMIATWEALILTPDNRLEHWDWGRIGRQLTVDEYEHPF